MASKQTVAQLREQITATQAEIATLGSAPIPIAEAEAAMGCLLDRAAALYDPAVAVFARDPDPQIDALSLLMPDPRWGAPALWASAATIDRGRLTALWLARLRRAYAADPTSRTLFPWLSSQRACRRSARGCELGGQACHLRRRGPRRADRQARGCASEVIFGVAAGAMDARRRGRTSSSGTCPTTPASRTSSSPRLPHADPQRGAAPWRPLPGEMPLACSALTAARVTPPPHARVLPEG
jgi:hypothetical protein